MKNKNKIIIFMIIGLMIFSCITEISLKRMSTESPIDDDPIVEKIIDETTTPITTTTITDDWFSGETVLSDIEFNKQTFHLDEVSTSIFPLSDIQGSDWYNLHYIWDDDGSNAFFHVWYDPYLASSCTVNMHLYVYCGGAGVFTYNVEVWTQASTSADIYSGEGYGTLGVTSSMLDNEGYLLFELTSKGSLTNSQFDLAYIPVGQERVWLENVFTVGSIPDVKDVYVLIDAFYFTRTTIENNIRSEYQYVSDTMITHKLVIPSVPHAKEMNVYAPVHWTYSSINPTATVTIVDSDHTINSPTELTYTMFFESNSTYLLAIEDVTETYLQDVGFESGVYSNDWTSNFTTSINTSVSFDGLHSVKLVSAVAKTFTLSASDFGMNGYYLSFALYLSAGSITITTDDYSDTISTVTDRWQIIQFFSQTDDLVLNSSSVTCFIDDFKLFLPSTIIDTVGVDEYEISNSFVVWDGYQNVPATNKEVELKGYYRNYAYEPANTWSTYSFLEETVITDSNGVATTTLSATLEQKECVILAYSEDSGFSENLNTRLDLFTSGSGTQSITENAQGEIEIVGKIGYYNGAYRFTFTYDFSDMYVNEFTVFTITSKFNDTVGLANQECRQNFEPSPYHREYITKDTDYTTDFGLYGFWGTWNTINTNGVIDQEYLRSYPLLANGFHFYSSITYLDKFFLFTISNINVLQAQAFIFTPSYPYNLDYAEEDLLDIWDFSEGDDERWGIYDTFIVENGYAYDEDASPRYGNTFVEGNPDLTDYDKIVMRYKTNVTDWFLKGTGVYDYDFDLNGDEDWHIINHDLISDLKIVHTQLEIRSIYAAYIYIDFIRLVHVEEPETYLTNTYLGFGSENDKWISAVYSDDIFLGYYNDPNFVYLNLTNGIHNISRLPVARQGETKAFLYSNIYTYTYQVSDPSNYFLLLNPPSYDIDAGLIYIDVVSFWGNQTVRVWMNETWLGDAVSEGSSVWECDFSSAGYYNFTVFVYNGAEVWTTLTSSITIPSTEEESLQLLFLTKDVDTSVSQVFVNYYTNWGNTTLIVFDNSTQLGTELSGEGASIWSFSQVEYYTFHNISVCIYHDSELQFIYYFSFTIQAPMLPDNYFILLNPPSYDIDAGLIYIDLVTYYGNCTYQVKMNESSLGDAVSEGSSVWSCDFSQTGFYNFTVYVYQGGTVWSTLTSSITIPEPAAPEGLIIEIWNKDVDVAAGLIYINVISSWGNQSVILQDNSTFLGDYASEGASIWLFSSSYGLHNISIWLYNDLTPMFVEYFSFTIQKPSLEIFTVHFDLFTIAGIGLPFETAKIYVNDSRIYNPQQYYLEDSFIEVKVRDYYNHLLYATNATITANRDIALYVRLFGQQIRNTYKIPIEVYFISTFDSNYNHSYVVAAEGSISVLLFSSSYHVLVKPLQDEYQNSTHVTYFYATTSEYQDLGDETKSYAITMETDLEPLDLEEPKEVRTWPAWVIAASAIFINAILISFIGAMGKWGIVKIWNYGLYYPNKGANWVLRKFRSERELHWCVEHKGGLEFVTPEQHKKAEALKKEGQF